MRTPVLGFVAVLGFGVAAILAQGRGASLPLGQPGPNLPAGKAPEQGFVPDAWNPHEGGLLKYRVQIRFGEEPDTMPDGFKFGRVSAVTTDAAGHVYAFHRGAKADPDRRVRLPRESTCARGARACSAIRTASVSTSDGNIWAIDNGAHQVFKFTRDGALLAHVGHQGRGGHRRQDLRPPDRHRLGLPGQLLRLGWLRQLACREVRRDQATTSPRGARQATARASFAWFTRSASTRRIGCMSATARTTASRYSTRTASCCKIWTHLGATQGIFITPKDEMWIITHRNNTENITYDTLAGRLMKIDLETGKVLGAMESPGHELTVAPTGRSTWRA